MRTLTLLLFLTARAAFAAGALDLPAPPEDWRVTRELQQKAQGSPSLPPQPGSSGELALGLGELSAQGGGAMQSSDYNALYSLLQRYRDQLVGLGLDADALESRVRSTQAQAQDLQQRLDRLIPLDGSKIHGRLRSSLEDFHLTGAKAFNFPSPAAANGPNPAIAPKVSGAGVRHQTGVLAADLGFNMTRGPFAGLLEIGMAGLWGGGAEFNLRSFKAELRLPVALEVGTLDLALTPFTLWRNEDAYPFEPEPFRSRRERIRRDYQLLPERSRLSAARLSTDLRLFESFGLELESITSVPALAYFDTANSNLPISFLYRFLDGDQLMATNNTLLQGWRVAVPLGPVKPSYTGLYQVTATDTRPGSQYRQMHSLVQSGRLELKAGVFRMDLEGAASGYVAPSLTHTVEARALYGSAYRGQFGVEGRLGSLMAFGRSVDRRFHAAGAQGRTQDRNYEFLGPLGTEVSHIGADGRLGLGTALPPQVQWSTSFIPAGVVLRAFGVGGNLNPTGTFGHLLPYTFLAALSPYGEATPNRHGGGLRGELKLFGGALQPQASYEMADQLEWAQDPALDSFNGATVTAAAPLVAPFHMQKAQAGLRSAFTLGIPFELSAGATWVDLRNDQNSALLSSSGQPVPFAITALLTEAGFAFAPIEQAWFCVGWRHLEVSGVSDKEAVSRGAAAVWDQLGYGIKVFVAEGVRLDLLWETASFNNPDAPLEAYGLENALARVSVDF